MKKQLVGMELRSLNHLIHRYFDNYTHKKQIDSITGTNGWIIGYLADNADKDIYQKDLEEQFTITRSTASRVLNLMEQKGFVKRQSVAHDARLRKLVLTDKAWKIRALMKEDGDHMEAILTKGFTDEELKTLFDSIQRMKRNISNIQAE